LTCGFKFKRKPVPLSVIVGIALSVGALTLWGVASAVVPSFTDAGHSLTRIAKRVAAGPKTPEESSSMRNELDAAIKTYLKQVGKLPANEIANQLTEELHSSAYEVHAFDLPRGLKIVEVDTVLQACDYLVINDQSSVKVQSLPGMEVIEGSRIVTESGAPTLVLIGHSAGSTAKRPLIKVLALLPGDVADESGKAIPDISGEGTAAFAPNNKDIALNLSLWSVGTHEKLFSAAPNVVARTDDDNVHFNLEWKDGHYKLSHNLGKSPISPVYALVSSMRTPSNGATFKNYLGDSGIQFAQANALDKEHQNPQFAVRQLSESAGARPSSSRRHRHSAPAATGKIAYYLAGDSGVFEVNLKNDGDKWTFDSAKRLNDEQAKIAQHFVNPTDIKATAPAVATAAATTTTTVPAAVAAMVNTATAGSDIAVAPKPPAKIVVKQAPTPEGETPIQGKTSSASATSDKDAKQVALIPSWRSAETKSKDSEPTTDLVPVSQSAKNIANALIQKYSKSAKLKPGSRNNKGKASEVAATDDQKYAMTAAKEKTESATSLKSKYSTVGTEKTKTSPVVAERHKSSTVASEEHKTASTEMPTSSSTLTQKTKASEPTQKSKSKETAPVETASASHSTVPEAGELMQIDAGKIKIRRGPSSDYKSVAELDKGAKVVVVGKKDGWYKVRANGKEGYVYGGLVNYKKSDAYTTATVKQPQAVADSKQKPKTGDHVVVLSGVQDGKYKVQLANGKIGYVPKDSIDVKVDAPALVP